MMAQKVSKCLSVNQGFHPTIALFLGFVLRRNPSVWLGEKSSVCNRTLERMNGYTHVLNDKGQYRDYGKVGATLITGNEDGVKHCAMNILFSLSHIGYTISPQTDDGQAHNNVQEHNPFIETLMQHPDIREQLDSTTVFKPCTVLPSPVVVIRFGKSANAKAYLLLLC